ncbi:Prolyl 3-hydroxylase 1, partial [Xenotaenia resolanae]
SSRLRVCLKTWSNDAGNATSEKYLRLGTLYYGLKCCIKFLKPQSSTTENGWSSNAMNSAEFLMGKSFYSDDSFGLAAQHFEKALGEYFTANKECRALCEGGYRFDGYTYMEYSADLFQAMTDHYMQVLNCKQYCPVDLASTAGREGPFEDFLPSHFNYLQFSYYNSEKYEEAIECAKTFLLFHPENEMMTQNLNYYSAVLGKDKAAAIS